MIRIAGVVVLYNPSEDVFESVSSYAHQIEVLFAIDNSEYPNPIFIDRIRRLGNVIYKWNGTNIGVAKALNIGATLAIEQHCNYLLMMDQDSSASSNLIAEFSAYLSTHSSRDVGILSPFHAYRNFDRPRESVPIKEISVTITSGTLLNLAAYNTVGPFLDELFIDYVDFEYCLRLRSSGFKVVRLSNVVLGHTLGATETRKFLFRRVAVYNHPPVRVYYRFRNRLVVGRKYFIRFPLWSLKELVLVGNELVKILCFEESKLEKCRMGFKGIVHFYVNRLGKYDGSC